MLRRTLQIVALCCGALGLTIPAQAQFRFSTEALFMDKSNGSSQPMVSGPDSLSNEANSGIQVGSRFTFGATYDAYDIEMIGSQIQGWKGSSSGTLSNLLIFDDTANNPVVVPVPPANTLAFTNSLRDAAILAGVEDLESERLQAGARYFINGSSRLQDYQVNIGTNPTCNPWRMSVGWRQMRLNENSGFGITGVFDALDTATGAVSGDPGNIENDALGNAALIAAGYSLRSGAGDGYDAFDVPGGVAPDDLSIYYASTTQNILNGVQVSGGYQLFPEGALSVEIFGRTGIFQNKTRGNVGEYLIGSVNDDSSYQRTFSQTRNGVAFGGTLGLKAALPVTDYISLTAGYEAMYIANLALAAGQVGGLSNNPLGERFYTIDNGDTLIIHGATVGMQVTW